MHHALYVFLLFLPFFLSFFLRSGPPASSAPCVRISSLSLSIFPLSLSSPCRPVRSTLRPAFLLPQSRWKFPLNVADIYTYREISYGIILANVSRYLPGVRETRGKAARNCDHATQPSIQNSHACSMVVWSNGWTSERANDGDRLDRSIWNAKYTLSGLSDRKDRPTGGGKNVITKRDI